MGKHAERIANTPGNLITSNVNDLCFPVEMEPAADHGFSSISSTQFLIVALINGAKMILNSCSDRYELIKNVDIFAAIETMLKNFGVEFEATYTMLEYSAFEAVYVMPKVFIDLPGGDRVYARFTVSHSYNSLVKYRLLFGFFRIVCTNGLVIPVKSMEMINVMIQGKHTEKILKSISTLIESLNTFFGNSEQWTERYAIMYDRKIEKWEDRIVAVLEATGINKGAKDANLNAITNVMQMELNGGRIDKNKNRPSDWLVYNAINEGYVFNNSLNNLRPHMRTEKDMEVINFIYYNPIN